MSFAAHPQSMDMDRLIHDFRLCHGCGLCGEVCPRGAIVVDQTEDGEGLAKTPRLDESVCVHCGRCGSVCGSGAISQEKFEELKVRLARERKDHLVFFCRKLNLAQTAQDAAAQALPTPGLVSPLTNVRKVAQLSKVRLPGDTALMDVRCTGRIGARTILSLLLAGVKGVLIFACPPHDCEYGRDTCLSALHVEGLSSLLSAYGMGDVRVEILTTQPGSPEEVEEVIERFRQGRIRLTGAAGGRAAGF